MAVGRDAPILAADIGGTKTLVAVVQDGRIMDHWRIETLRSAHPADLLSPMLKRLAGLEKDVAAIGVAVSGQIEDSRWTSVNPATLDLGSGFDLSKALSPTGKPFCAVNDAQAAAWGEHLHGAGAGSDLVYLTVSTGLGGGIIAEGRLLRGSHGLAGHFGQVSQNLCDPEDGAGLLEDVVSGRWLSGQSRTLGHALDAQGVFACAHGGEEWARRLVRTSAHRVARLIRDIGFVIDPPLVVIGGAIGLADGFIAEIQERLSRENIAGRHPDIVPARLGPNAGVIGVAALAAQAYHQQRRPS